MIVAVLSDSTGITAVDTAVIWSLAAVAIAGALALAWRMIRGVVRILKRMEEVADDWQGVDARPGVPARAGVMARLDLIEGRVGTIEHELRPNSGQSLRDAVDRVDRRTRTLAPDSDE